MASLDPDSLRNWPERSGGCLRKSGYWRLMYIDVVEFRISTSFIAFVNRGRLRMYGNAVIRKSKVKFPAEWIPRSPIPLFTCNSSLLLS